MPKLSSVCRHIRSKNAGPFWITIDLFFKDAEAFERYSVSKQLTPAALAGILGVDVDLIGHYPVRDLAVLKISYPRLAPQGGVIERDLHGGQQYVQIVDLYLESADDAGSTKALQG